MLLATAKSAKRSKIQVMENNDDCDCEEVNKMFAIEKQQIPMLLAAVFGGVFVGYILGWYFSPKQINQPQVQTQQQIQASPTSAAPKLSDIVVATSGELLISTPRPGDTITTPLKVNGLVRGFENKVGMRLKNKDGVVVRETKFTAKQGEIGTFISLGADMIFAQPTVPGDGTFEAFTFSAKDGSEINKVVIPIKFAADGGSGL